MRLVVLIPFFLLQYIGLIAQKHFFSLDGHIQSISVVKLKNIDYFSFDVKESENYCYRFGKSSLIFLPGSKFFTLIDKSNTQYEFQMQRPTILLNNRLMIPLETFLDCLKNAGLFEYSSTPRSFAFLYKKHIIQTANVAKTKKEIIKENQKVRNEAKETKNKIEIQNDDKTLEPSSIPRLVLTNNERFSLVPPKGKRISVIGKSNNTNHIDKMQNDTTGKIPPKFYVLPPELKNNPK